MARRRKAQVKGKVKVVSSRASSKVLSELEGHLSPRYEFRLYIAGTNLNSVRAIENVRRLRKSLRPSRCKLEIIDLYQQPALAKRDQVVAAPALVKLYPLPRRTFVGDLSDSARVVAGLGIITASRDVRNKATSQ